jgi:hypothetical protein
LIPKAFYPETSY